MSENCTCAGVRVVCVKLCKCEVVCVKLCMCVRESEGTVILKRDYLEVPVSYVHSVQMSQGEGY